MKILFVVNDAFTEFEGNTTPILAWQAHSMGHEVFLAGVGDLMSLPDGHMGAKVRHTTKSTKSIASYMQEIRERDNESGFIKSNDLDVIFLRNNPSEETTDRAWAQNAGILFGQVAMRQGVIVLNHPDTLAYAIVDKMYFEHFPEIIRPKTIITRDVQAIKDFYEEQKHKLVLKPLLGSGGKDYS